MDSSIRPARGAREMLVVLFAVAAAQTAVAQPPAHKHDTRPKTAAGGHAPRDTGSAETAHAVHDAMSGHMDANPHLRLTPVRAPTAADSARAARIVIEARAGIAKYRDVRLAERDGYRMFAPGIRNQPVYHYTKAGAAIRAQFRFDAAEPTSLLYKRNADGSMRLVGAMYTAPKDATPEQLNERVPLGIARWHLHTNMCVPKMTQLERWVEFDGGKPVFGPVSPIATRKACDAVDGRFLPVVFNWMVHANVFESDVWEDHH